MKNGYNGNDEDYEAALWEDIKKLHPVEPRSSVFQHHQESRGYWAIPTHGRSHKMARGFIPWHECMTHPTRASVVTKLQQHLFPGQRAIYIATEYYDAPSHDGPSDSIGHLIRERADRIGECLEKQGFVILPHGNEHNEEAKQLVAAGKLVLTRRDDCFDFRTREMGGFNKIENMPEATVRMMDAIEKALRPRQKVILPRKDQEPELSSRGH